MMHATNVRAIPLAVPALHDDNEGSANASSSVLPKLFSWRDTIRASLDAFYNSNASHYGVMGDLVREKAPPRRVNVLFVDSPTLICPVHSGDDNNPDHQFHRVATASGLKMILGIDNMLFLAEGAATSPTTAASKVYGSRLFLGVLWVQEVRRNAELARKGSLVALATPLPLPNIPLSIASILALPDYLRTAAEQALAADFIQRHERSPSTRLPWWSGSCPSR